MEQYRHFIRQEYSVRQVLVEHQHFNDRKSASISAGSSCARAIRARFPSSASDDPVSDRENRKWELFQPAQRASRRS